MKTEFLNLVKRAFDAEILKKLVFSKSLDDEVIKVSARLCSHRGTKILAAEFTLKSNTVAQRNFKEDNLLSELSVLMEKYKQVNLITTLGDAEWKSSKKGKEIILGLDALSKKLSGEKPSFENAIEALDKKKNYILEGGEDFLIALGISDKSGRVHDKKQGKFRQINRFLEHIEDISDKLPRDREILIYDLCSGKSYLSFAVYYYFTKIKCLKLKMLCIDLKSDVIKWCSDMARTLGYLDMQFICDDIKNTPRDASPDMVISLHACDIATDIVINSAIDLGAKIILSTPCCHRYLNDKINQPALSFVTDFPHLRNKLCEAITDSIRLKRLSASGYTVSALELTDPENTPKNTLIRAVLDDRISEAELKKRATEYEEILSFVLGDNKASYLQEI
jgi:hypothetical protein